jgi:hypothetical protein
VPVASHSGRPRSRSSICISCSFAHEATATRPRRPGGLVARLYVDVPSERPGSPATVCSAIDVDGGLPRASALLGIRSYHLARERPPGSPARLNVVEEIMRGASPAPLATPRPVRSLPAPAAAHTDRPDLAVRTENPGPCALCGNPLETGPLLQVRSPYSSEEILVCRICCRVAIGEGYMPAA